MPSEGRKPASTSRQRARNHRELSAAELRWVCRPGELGLGSADKDQSLIGIIGQERAIRALKLGIELYGPGYNVFVCGIAGTGRSSTVQRILDRIKRHCPIPPDHCYVYNFSRPDEPRLLTLPRGNATVLRDAMERFVKDLQTAVPALLDSEAHVKKREKIISKYEGEADQIIEKFDRRADREGFSLKRVREGSVTRLELFPIVDSVSHSIAEFENAVAQNKVPKKRAATILSQYQELGQRLHVVAGQSRDLMARMESEVDELEKQDVRAALQVHVDAILKRCPDVNGRVGEYLGLAVDHITASLDLFRPRPALQPQAPVPAGSPIPAAGNWLGAGSRGPADTASGPKELLDRLQVNVILDSMKHGECPVVIEDHPSYRRLFGYFEKSIDQSGHWTTDYSRIRPGSLLAADGGYLVVKVEDVFSEPEVWAELKGALIRRELAILDETSGIPTIAMKPDPIPINVKVIMIGQRGKYEALLRREPDFQKIFKVLADFDDEMDLSAKTLRQYAAFVQKTCAAEGLAALEPSAVAAVAEYGARRAGHQGKLSTRFGEIADVLREADYWRRVDGEGRKILVRHVKSAIEESEHRRNLTEEKLREMIRLGQVLIDVKGERVGQANVLTIQASQTHTFGLPARITATVSPGTSGIISLEREADMSGRYHTKGVLTIGGFLREKFGLKKPVTLTASITFEQSYAGIEGDSASSAEVYIILSALARLPLRQGLGVTGSVDQKGDIEPVGGINDKIEGFFKVCSIKGLTGDQGVIMPEANLRDLMLDDEVVEAVKKRKFHIYPVRTIEEGIEILSGVPAGLPDASGCYPDKTVFRLVDDRLTEYSELMKKFAPAPPL